MLKYIELKCEVCDKFFLRYIKHHEGRKTDRVLCSKSCALKGNCFATGEKQKQQSIDTFVDRFWVRVDKKEEGCWIWTGPKKRNGYGFCKRLGKNVSVHRISFEFSNGPIAPNFHVLHSCDNRLCVNPDHLFLGNHKDNLEDMFAKGRNTKGEDVFSSKLTEENVRAIRLLSDSYTKNDLAKMFNVSPHTIYAVKSRRSWKQVN